MTTLYDVPAEDLIEAVAEDIASELDDPDWIDYVKTGHGRELPPEQEDFWARRCASLLRKVAADGPVGVERLRSRLAQRRAQKSSCSGGSSRPWPVLT